MTVAAFASVVHAFTDLKYLPNTVSPQMLTLLHKGNDLLELPEVSLLLGRQERKPLEERYYVLRQGRQVGGLVVPHTIGPASKSAAPQVPLEEGQYDPIPLRYVEAERDLPRYGIVLAWPKRNVEAAFPVCKARQVIPNLRWNLLDPRVH